ncbi:MAG: RNA-2',3'-PO4:RNA-5'-OH ligase, partial [uncultured Friedmanniella sp.]
GDGVVRRGGAGEPGRALLGAARGRSGVLADRRPQDVHPGEAAGGDGGHRVPRLRGLPRRDPGGLRGHRPGDGRRGAAGAGAAHAAADRQTSGATEPGDHPGPTL